MRIIQNLAICLIMACSAGCDTSHYPSRVEQQDRAEAAQGAAEITNAPTAIVLPKVAEPDDLEFIHVFCAKSMESEPSIPLEEREKFCECLTDKVDRDFTPAQKEALDAAQRLMSKGEEIPPMHFVSSGLKESIENSQNYCTNELWSQSPSLSEEEHLRFSALANTSVDEFESLITERCGTISVPMTESACAKRVAREWMDTMASTYSEIPEPYITGNALASSLLQDAP